MIENLGNVGDFVGGIGVFVTLMYLAVQIRQNTRSLRLTSVQQIMGTSVSVNQTASNGPVPSILAKLEQKERLTEEEFAQLLMYIWAMLTQHWQVFHQYQNGMIEKNIFDAYMARLRVTLGPSISRAMWSKRIKNSFPADFQQYVQNHIDRVD